MKLNDIDFNKMSNKDLITLSLKYKLIEERQIPSLTREKLLFFRVKKRIDWGSKQAAKTTTI